MSEQIKSAIEWCEEFEIAHDLKGGENNNFMYAIRSLKAWEQVLNELEEQKIACNQNSAFITSGAIQLAIDIINQKLEQIKEGEQK